MPIRATAKPVAPMPIKSAVNLHDGIASSWDDRYLRGGFKRRAAFFTRTIMPELPAGGAWLDAGCGSGYFSRLIAQRAGSVVGVDAAPQMVAQARHIAALAGLSDRLAFEEISSLGALSFADARFDGCLCLSVIEYLDDPPAALREIARVMRPGGVLVVSVPNRRSVVRGLQRAVARTRLGRRLGLANGYIDYSRFAATRADLVRILAEAGFKVRSIRGFDPVIPGALARIVPAGLFFALAEKAAIPRFGKVAGT